jgi:AraC family L-rhamnose operon transcriptional activator RhaR
MEGNLARRWTLAELADRLAIDRKYLIHVFRESFGIPPMEYLHRRRAEAAASLLVRSDEPVAAVGAKVGWDEPAHFARRFRAHYGLSPTAYRSRALSGVQLIHSAPLSDPRLPISGARYASPSRLND